MKRIWATCICVAACYMLASAQEPNYRDSANFMEVLSEKSVSTKTNTDMTIYDFTVLDTKKQPVSLAEYKGKVLLVVNTATGCGFTPQYEGLETLYKKYKDRGLVILDFPCNQFAGQAPGTEEEIVSFCKLKYDVSFPQFAKIKVNGDEADPLYVWLKDQKRGTFGKAIKWNFTKFLIDREGNVIERYAPMTKPEDIEKDLLRLL